MLAPVRKALVRQVRATFNDRSKGEKPIPASDDALFPRGSVIRRVHGDVTSMMVGGVAALLTQMLHPKALAGVWDHSGVAEDQLGRLRRTARFIAVTTYGHRDSALAAIAKVKAIHAQVSGTLPDGSDYRAAGPWLLAWVHVAGAINFLDGWRRYADPGMSRGDQDLYFAESGEIARLLDADPVPGTRAEAERLIEEFRAELRADDRTRAFRDLVLRAPPASLAEAPVQKLLMSASVDLMPGFAREMHGLSQPLLPPMVRGATYGVARTLRWAFAGEHYRATH
ncbi:oxygenase MpaB family protein [Sphingomonas sp. URHD0057]|uniref:oxygenase MpaB family protein n=1 Tax=Sphingomonas sp. URHD0057 TaxID=1380389 RepID=UPI00055FCA19|nr:oxygenase MpaB family protein [Sphingomonas sp. URHD0057]